MENKLILTDCTRRNLDSLNSVSEFARAIAQLYERETTQESFIVIKKSLDSSISSLGNLSNEEIKRGSEYLERFSKEAANNNEEDFYDLLAATFAQLFLGVGEEPVNVVESVCLGSDHIFYDRQYFEIRDIFSAWGYQKPSDFLEPEDHIACEIAFMAHCLTQAAENIARNKQDKADGYLKVASTFKRDHLDTWITFACDDIERLTASPLYLGLSHLTRAFMNMCA